MIYLLIFILLILIIQKIEANKKKKELREELLEAAKTLFPKEIEVDFSKDETFYFIVNQMKYDVNKFTQTKYYKGYPIRATYKYVNPTDDKLAFRLVLVKYKVSI